MKRLPAIQLKIFSRAGDWDGEAIHLAGRGDGSRKIVGGEGVF